MKRNPKVKVELQAQTSSNYVSGLYMKDGRLINDRAPGMSGIEQAANMRRIIHENRKDMMDYFG